MAQSSASRARRQYDLGSLQPHIFRIHDLKSVALLEHSVLVDTRAMGKGVGTDDRLVGLDRDAHQATDQPASGDDFLGDYLGIKTEIVLARL